jgi:shikimate dehydrogenase
VRKPHDPSFPPEPVNLAVAKEGAIHGFNTDIHGLMEPLVALQPERLDLSGRTQKEQTLTAVVLGAGGVLYSVAWVLMSLGYNPIILVARSREKVERFLERADRRQFGVLPWGDPLPSCDLLVNATPLGMEGQGRMPYDASSVRAGGIVFEMLYHPLETCLLADARARGLRCIDGLQMLLGQAAPSFQLLFGAPAPRQHDQELRELLTA